MLYTHCKDHLSYKIQQVNLAAAFFKKIKFTLNAVIDVKEPPRCGPKSVPKSQFCAHSLRYHRELSSEVFHELALLVCQKYIFKLIPKIFETTNVGAHPAGTDLSFIKIVFYFFKFEIKIYKPILTFDKKIPQNFF